MTPRGVRTFALLAALTNIAANGCVSSSQPYVNSVSTSAFYAEELNRARDDEMHGRWQDARGRLQTLARVTTVQDPLGAEARGRLAHVDFEIGDYAGAIAAGEGVGEGPWYADMLENVGLSQLFRCEFDDAIKTFSALRTVDAVRGGGWLGMTYAWTGARDNAERELQAVITASPNGPEAANARFYLLQQALWSGNDRERQQYETALQTTAPTYTDALAQRADNWVSRQTHLMRAYFTYETLQRDAIASHRDDAAFAARADQALAGLQQMPGACGAQVTRLAAARAAWVAGPRQRAIDAERQSVQARAEYERTHHDTDGDGIPDVTDRCPEQAETVNGIDDRDGCPEQTAAVELVGNQIRIRSGNAIYFETGQADVLPASQPVLDQVQAVLQQYAWIRRIRLEGHTDDVGDASANLALSMDRVRHVAAWLVGHGIDRSRVEFVGYGEQRPLVAGTDDAARMRNRRVEIMVTDPPMFGGARASN